MRHLTQTAVAALIIAGASATASTPAHAFLDLIFGGGQRHYQYRQAAVQPQGYDMYRPAPQRVPREVVHYSGPHAPGTIVISTSERRLYLILPGHKALRYGIGVGREGFQWSGTQTISRKQEWPDWVPPKEMLQRRPDLPRHMAGGPDNPLGARAMYLGSSLYRIHGSNEPETIGTAVSSGCIRMLNEDVVDLYNRVKVGTKVVVLR